MFSSPFFVEIDWLILSNCGEFVAEYQKLAFLDAPSHCYKRVCPSVFLLVCPIILVKMKKMNKKLKNSVKNERGHITWQSTSLDSS